MGFWNKVEDAQDKMRIVVEFASEAGQIGVDVHLEKLGEPDKLVCDFAELIEHDIRDLLDKVPGKKGER